MRESLEQQKKCLWSFMWKDVVETTNADVIYCSMGHEISSLLCVFATSHLIFYLFHVRHLLKNQEALTVSLIKYLNIL